MKFKKLLTFCVAASIATSITFPGLTTLAASPFDSANIISNYGKPVLRYKYIQSASLIFTPSDSGADYNLNIIGTSSVTSISGTVTLYKKNSAGTYLKIDSEPISVKGSSIDKTSSLSTSKSGSYKIEFVGNVNTSSGSEPITISKTNSY